jgi:hypothetical protein
VNGDWWKRLQTKGSWVYLRQRTQRKSTEGTERKNEEEFTTEGTEVSRGSGEFG